MSDATGRELSEAYELIEAERLDEARTVLKPLLEADKDNPDVWWLYAHAVSDVEGARLALNQVLQLDPNYPEARDLLTSLESKVPVTDSFGDDDDFDPSFLPDDMPSTLPGLFDDDDDLPDDSDFDDDDFDDEDDDDEETERKSLLQQPALLAAIVLFVLVAVIAIALVLLNPSPSTPPTATSVAADSTFTPLPVDTVAPIPTVDGSLQTLPEGNYDELLQSLNIVAQADSARVTQTSLGDTLLVKVCSTDRREARTLLPQVMNELAQQNNTIADPVSAIGTEIINCDDLTPLLVIAAPFDDAVAYANDSLTEAEFEATWRPVG